MQLANVMTDAAKDYGITYARQQYNASLPQMVQDGVAQDGEVQTGVNPETGAPIMSPRMVPNMVANPALIASDAAYLLARIGTMVDSWAEQADMVSPPPAPPPGAVNGVPQEVSRRQARQALILSGKFNLVQPAINAIADPTQRALMQSEWDDSQSFLRQRPSLIQMATAIGLTSADLDNLFKTAATL